MYAVTIQKYLNVLISPSTNFLGVFSRDLIPIPLHTSRYPLCFVVNICSSESPGDHWVAFYYTDINHCEFFDSYGIPAPVYGFNVPVNKHSPYPIQIQESSMCGYFCVHFLYHRSLGYSFYSIVIALRTHLEDTDSIVGRLIDKSFKFYDSLNINSHSLLQSNQLCVAQECAIRALTLSNQFCI